MKFLEIFSGIWEKHKIAIEILLILGWCTVGYLHAGKYDMLENFYRFSRAHEDWEVDEWVAVVHVLALAFGIFAFRRWMENRRIKKELTRKNNELEKTMSEIKTLQGIIPICASCKKIRNDKGYWSQVEEYLHEHTDAAFTHGLCPECRDKSYAEYLRNKELKSRLAADLSPQRES